MATFNCEVRVGIEGEQVLEGRHGWHRDPFIEGATR